MISEPYNTGKRPLKSVKVTADFIVAGGGMSGVCAAITAARAGIKVALFQDRPVLGGNASSEVRVWILGATSHLGNNNRWSREGGVIDEILVENLFRNKDGNPVILDTIILEKVKNEKNITLFLNTVIYDADKDDCDRITKLYAFCPQNETFYEAVAKFFCDATGDGILGYRVGVSYRMGSEEMQVYNEKFIPDKDEYGGLLGHTIYFYSKDVGRPVKFVAPAYALKDITKIFRFGNINSGEYGCKFWWIEYGGRKDTVHDTEEIKWELWSVVYGIWNYIKNSGKFPETENYTLEWVGTFSGKRESRRFLGHYTLIQRDIVEQVHFDDTVAFGGWAVDLHPADGIYSSLNGCTQYHSKGIYEIPYRCFISKEVKNLFFSGRNISASHVAHGSTRVMATSALGGQAVGMAAALCIKKSLTIEDLIKPKNIKMLQQHLNLTGQSIPHVPIDNSENLAATARISVSGTLVLDMIPFDGDWRLLDISVGQLLPLVSNTRYAFEVALKVMESTNLNVELWTSTKTHNYTPDLLIENICYHLSEGTQYLKINFEQTLSEDQYAFLIFRSNLNVKIQCSEKRFSGIVSVFNSINPAVNNYGKQMPPRDSGFEAFEFWCPERRPNGKNLAMRIAPAIVSFSVLNIINGFIRPYLRPNAWVADLNDSNPWLMLEWEKVQIIHSLTFYFDTDYDHPMESVQMGHPEDVIPFCVRNYKIYDMDNKLIFEKKDNYQTINKIVLEESIQTNRIKVVFEKASSDVPVALFEIRIN
ncbi:MAG: FAD-dependent oxidoreductase [Dysgonamonadaceae bacterium]|jgi:hypothetical protein|nr:FAD-dependent oxidoreductase [Dysgonamonadaceae bacterium]